MLLWLFTLTLKLEIAMLGRHIIWMTGISCMSLFWCSFSAVQYLTTNMIWTLLRYLPNGLLSPVRTGVWVFAMIPVLIEESTECAPNVEENIGLKKLRGVMKVCKTRDEERVQAVQQVEAAVERPRQFLSSSKTKSEDLVLGPRFRRRYVWSDSEDSCSPAMLNTEIADPFPSPPVHLLNDSMLLTTLAKLQGFVNTDTPFDIDKLELFLGSHPNQPFVKSIIRSLREGFWPFDGGDWDDSSEDMDNYSSEAPDLSAIREF